MALTSPENSSAAGSATPKRLTIGLLVSISSLMGLCAKHASRFSSKLKPTNTKSPLHRRNHHLDIIGSPKTPPRSPLARPKQLLSQISNKAITLAHGNERRKKGPAEEKEEEAEEFGDGGVWQRAILMGDKCQPLDFSGVIYYDSSGKQLNELPIRSPRASPLPGYLMRGK